MGVFKFVEIKKFEMKWKKITRLTLFLSYRYAPVSKAIKENEQD